ncbi:MAG TPA: hypothetical protein VF120_01385 [Ktedonobacterales bacterium]
MLHDAFDTLIERLPFSRARALQAVADRTAAATSHGQASAAQRSVRIPLRVQLAVAGALAVLAAVVYARSLTNALVGDDWVLVEHSAGGLGAALSWTGNYHYNPVVQVMLLVIYAFFGVNPIAYHAAALLFFWASSVGVLYVGWRLSGRYSVGVIAAILFICQGRQYEAVIWGAVALFQTVGLVLFLGGFLGYLLYLDARAERRRRWAYGVFLAGVILGPFAYEPEVVLTLVCMLYRLFVVEAQRGWSMSELRSRAPAWVRDFAAPVILLGGYGLFKEWLGRTANQAPGLSDSLSGWLHTAERGIAVAFTPGISLYAIAPPPLAALASHSIIQKGVLVLAAAALILLVVRGTPLYQFLLASTLLVVLTMTVALGTIASRHILLLCVPAVILLALLLSDMTRWLGDWLSNRDYLGVRLTRMRPALRWAPAGLMVVAWVVLGAHYAFIQQQTWTATAAEEDRLVAQIDAFVHADPGADTLYLVNLPDYNASPTGDIDDPAFLFRNGAPSLIRLTMPRRFALVEAAYTGLYDPWRVGISATEQQLDSWSQQGHILVLHYDATRGDIQRWQSPVSG